MGYRSDVWVGLLVKDEKDALAVLQEYGARKRVKENKILNLWTIQRNSGTGRVLFLFEETSIKWYDSYEDVQAIKEIHDAAITIGIDYAFREIEFGEEIEDTKDYMDYQEESSLADTVNILSEEMWNLFSVSRCCDVNSEGYESVPTIDTYKLFAA